MPLDDWFVGRPAEHRAIYEAVADHLRAVGPIVVDAADVGILIKRTRTFAELRPKRGGLALSIILSRPLAHPRITRTVRASTKRTAYFVELTHPEDVDDDVRGWLTESYLEC